MEPRARASKNVGKSNFNSTELTQFLIASGDARPPLPETIRVLDEILTEFVQGVSFEAVRVAHLSGRQKVKYEDFQFAMRKNMQYLGKAEENKELNAYIQSQRKVFGEDGTVGVDGGGGGGGGLLAGLDDEELLATTAGDGEIATSGKTKGRGGGAAAGRRKKQQEDVMDGNAGAGRGASIGHEGASKIATKRGGTHGSGLTGPAGRATSEDAELGEADDDDDMDIDMDMDGSAVGGGSRKA